MGEQLKSLGEPWPGIELLIDASHKFTVASQRPAQDEGRGNVRVVRDENPRSRSRPRTWPRTGERHKKGLCARGLPLELPWVVQGARAPWFSRLQFHRSVTCIQWYCPLWLSPVGDHRWRRHSRGHRPGPKCGPAPLGSASGSNLGFLAASAFCREGVLVVVPGCTTALRPVAGRQVVGEGIGPATISASCCPRNGASRERLAFHHTSRSILASNRGGRC